MTQEYYISTGIHTRGTQHFIKWLSVDGEFNESTDINKAASVSYRLAREMCSTSSHGWLAYPVHYVHNKIGDAEEVSVNDVWSKNAKCWRFDGFKKDRGHFNLKKKIWGEETQE